MVNRNSDYLLLYVSRIVWRMLAEILSAVYYAIAIAIRLSSPSDN